jgi:hypothetical protein
MVSKEMGTVKCYEVKVLTSLRIFANSSDVKNIGILNNKNINKSKQNN